ncbi:MAG: helix-turn-helix domain-containing protein [Fastidiosipilaceae bacterium]|jgi:transcriptional regulator with XRE-family HTH domain
MSSIGSRLRKARDKAGLKQNEVAKELDVTRSVIARYESETNDPPTENVIKMAEMYGVSADYLLCLTDDPRPVDDIKKDKTPDLDAPLRQQSLAEAFYKISEMSWEFDLDTETMHMLIDKAVAKFGPPPHMEKGGIAAHGPSVPGTGIFDKEDDSN